MSDPAVAATGVIHDIGYRHYEGRMLGRPAIVLALFVDSLRGAYGLGRSTGSKVMPALLLAGMGLPALVVGVVVNVGGAHSLPLPYTRYAVALQLVISIYVAGQAPAAVSRDLRFRVVSLYFSRPLSRGDYVLAKFAGLASAVFVLIGTPLAVLYASALLAKLSFWQQTSRFLLGLVGAALFALTLAGIALVIAAITPRRGLGVAAIITTLLLLGIVSDLGQAVADHLGHTGAAGYLGLIDPYSLVDGVQVWVLHAETSSTVAPPGALGGAVFTAVTAGVIAGCYGLLVLRYRKVSLS